MDRNSHRKYYAEGKKQVMKRHILQDSLHLIDPLDLTSQILVVCVTNTLVSAFSESNLIRVPGNQWLPKPLASKLFVSFPKETGNVDKSEKGE